MTDTGHGWLAADERAAWLALVSVMTRLPAALDAQLQADSSLTHFEYGVLAVLSEAPGRTLRMSVLAGLAEGTLPRLSQVVGRLERRGLVCREPDPADGRFTLAQLTDEGWQAVVAAAPGHVALVRRLVFDRLTASQVRELTEIGRSIMGAVDPGDRCLTGSTGPDLIRRAAPAPGHR